MKAGFARRTINPSIGTRMLGFGGRDHAHGCEGIHDDIYANALYMEQGRTAALIVSADLCFFDRAQADRVRGMLCRVMDMKPGQIMLNTSHTHAGPATAGWGYVVPESKTLNYMNYLCDRIAEAALEAKSLKQDAFPGSGHGTTSVPVSRRYPDGKGGIEWRPYPDGVICDNLPVCLFQDAKGRPICLLFSAACHPSTIGNWMISSDYPGVATKILNRELGFKRGGAMFLQAAGGDTKASVISDGHDGTGPSWRSGSWADVARAGKNFAKETLAVLANGLEKSKPALASHEIEMIWPLAQPMSKRKLQAIADDAGSNDSRKSCLVLWAQTMLERIATYGRLENYVSIILQGIRISGNTRIVGIEGEAVAAIGNQIRASYPDGITFALGYIHGTRMYLPSEAMLKEGGYEVRSYYEYSIPAPLRVGFENTLQKSLTAMKAAGIR